MNDKSQIRDAATIILLRDAATVPSVLMGQRGSKAAFLPSKYVFPGGAVDHADGEVTLAAPLPVSCLAKLVQSPVTRHAPRPETLAAAAIRELWEETGVTQKLVTIEAESRGLIPYDLPADLVPNIWGGKYRGQEQKWFLMRFHGTDEQVNIVTEHPEFSSWKWLPKDDLVANIVPFKREVYAQVLAEFRGKI